MCACMHELMQSNQQRTACADRERVGVGKVFEHVTLREGSEGVVGQPLYPTDH